MYKFVKVEEKDLTIDYEFHYNKRPEKSEEISEERFFRQLDDWSWDYVDNKQIRENRVFERAKLFLLETHVGIIGIYVSILPDNSRKFYQFGNWSDFYKEQQKFFG